MRAMITIFTCELLVGVLGFAGHVVRNDEEYLVKEPEGPLESDLAKLSLTETDQNDSNDTPQSESFCAKAETDRELANQKLFFAEQAKTSRKTDLNVVLKDLAAARKTMTGARKAEGEAKQDLDQAQTRVELAKQSVFEAKQKLAFLKERDTGFSFSRKGTGGQGNQRAKLTLAEQGEFEATQKLTQCQGRYELAAQAFFFAKQKYDSLQEEQRQAQSDYTLADQKVFQLAQAAKRRAEDATTCLAMGA
jgi:hypothetical protein